MGPMNFFDGDFSIFPFIIMFFFIVMFILRAKFFKRGGFMSEWRNRRDHMFGDDFSTKEKRHRPVSTAPKEDTLRTPVGGKNQVNTAMQTNLDKARSYQRQINDLAKSGDGQYRPQMQELVAHVDTWIEAIEDLTKQVDDLQRNSLIRQDLESVPVAIDKLEARLTTEHNQATRWEMEQTLDSRKKQLAALQQLQNTIDRAELKIENTLSSLGTIYSHLLTTQSTDQVADYDRLSAEVDEEVRTLQDYLDALKEVKLSHATN